MFAYDLVSLCHVGVCLLCLFAATTMWWIKMNILDIRLAVYVCLCVFVVCRMWLLVLRSTSTLLPHNHSLSLRRTSASALPQRLASRADRILTVLNIQSVELMNADDVNSLWQCRSVVKYGGSLGQSDHDIKLFQTPQKINFTSHLWHVFHPRRCETCSCPTTVLIERMWHFWGSKHSDPSYIYSW